MRQTRLLWTLIRRAHFERFLLFFVLLFFGAALLIFWAEPGIHTYGDALWFTFVACSTIGFGDLTATTLVARLCTVAITICEIVVVGLFSGVIVSYYLEVIHRRERLTATVFMDRLEHLTELSREELEEVQEKVKQFREKETSRI